jgi:hypothetical protein
MLKLSFVLFIKLCAGRQFCAWKSTSSQSTKPLAVSLKMTMKQTLNILTFLILAGCGQSNSEQAYNIVLDTVNDEVSVTTKSDSNVIAQQNSTDENQTKNTENNL